MGIHLESVLLKKFDQDWSLVYLCNTSIRQCSKLIIQWEEGTSLPEGLLSIICSLVPFIWPPNCIAALHWSFKLNAAGSSTWKLNISSFSNTSPLARGSSELASATGSDFGNGEETVRLGFWLHKVATQQQPASRWPGLDDSESAGESAAARLRPWLGLSSESLNLSE